MKINFISSLRNQLIRFTSGEAGPFKSFFIRNGILLTLLFTAVPWSVAREISHGDDHHRHNLKNALRMTIWLWNRSWVPTRFPMNTFFDIGWMISETSCNRLAQRGFVSRNELKRHCDLAQLRLSSIRAGYENGEPQKIDSADREIVENTQAVFTKAARWADSAGSAPNEPSEPIKPAQSPDGKFHNPATKSALLDFKRLCDDIGQEFFLVSGTFLGAVRDKAFIGHDNDIDLGIFEDKLLDTLIPALERSEKYSMVKADYMLERACEAGKVQYRMMDKPSVIKFVHESGIGIDLFVHFDEDDVSWHGGSQQRWDNSRFELADYNFLETTFRGAADANRYLTENYGPNWRIPVVDFDTNTDTPNIAYAGTANSLVFWAWMVARAMLEGKVERTRKYLDLLAAQGVYHPEVQPQNGA